MTRPVAAPSKLGYSAWFSALAFVIALAFAGFAYFLAKTEMQYELNGRYIAAIVTDKERRERVGSNGNTQYTYYLFYRFATPEGQPVAGEDSVWRDTYFETSVDQDIEVQYLPHDPDTNRLAGSGNWIGIYVVTGLGAVALFVAVILFVRALLNRLADLRIVRNGVLRAGDVIEIQDVETKPGRPAKSAVLYAYKGDDGQAYQGTSAPRPSVDLSSYQPGDHLDIYVDRRDPSRSAWARDIGVL